jgi:hypothetical protein
MLRRKANLAQCCLLLTAALKLFLPIVPARAQEQDLAAYVQDLETRAESGDSDAVNGLGKLYSVRSELAADLRALQNRADAGDPQSEFLLGAIRSHKDFTEGSHWFRLAADQGYAPAQVEIGLAYAFGHGVPQDPAEAARWYQLAANQGSAKGQACLGSAYAAGTGVNRDLVQAYKWLTLAIPKLSEGGRKLPGDLRMDFTSVLDSLVPEMTPEQIEEGKKLATEWKPIVIPTSTPTSTPPPRPIISSERGAASGVTTPPTSDEAPAIISREVADDLKFFGALLVIATVWIFFSARSRRKRKRRQEAFGGPVESLGEGYEPLRVGVPHAASFKSLPNGGFVVVLEIRSNDASILTLYRMDLRIEVTPDAVTIMKKRYSPAAFKGFIVKQGVTERGTPVAGSAELYFAYGDVIKLLGIVEFGWRYGAYFGQHECNNMIGALNDRLREVLTAGSPGNQRPAPEHLRNTRPSDF